MGNHNSRVLLEAASSGNLAQLKSVLGSTDVNVTDEDGWTALHFSAWAGRLNIVQELLKQGADVNLRDKVGRTPLHLAALRVQAEAVAALCDHGALINALDDDGVAPIHKAVIHSNTEVAEELIACGADANFPLHDGTTPLHLAALQGHPPMIVLLLANGASVNAEDVDGQTPLFVAAAAGHADAVQALLDARANPEHKDKEGKTAASEAPADVAVLLRRGAGQGWKGLPRTLSTPGQEQKASSRGQATPTKASEQNQPAPSGWSWLGLFGGGPQVSPAAAHSPLQRAPAIVRPSDAQRHALPAQPTASIQMQGLPEGSLASIARPSAPLLPGPYSNLCSTGAGSAQGMQPLMAYPELTAAQQRGAEDGSASPFLPPPTQWLGGAPASTSEAASSAVQQQVQAEQQLASGAAAAVHGGAAAAAAAAAAAQEQPPGAVAWAVQAAGAASGAAFSALLGALPWSRSDAAQNEGSAQEPAGDSEERPGANEQRSRSGRYGLLDDEADEAAEGGGDMPGRSAGGGEELQRMMENMDLGQSGVASTPYALYRPEELWEATEGFSASSRLDHGAFSSAHRAMLSAGSAASEEGIPAGAEEADIVVRAYDWGPQRALTLQSDLVNRLAELRHPNLLPLLGVCAESRLFVYGLMPNGSVDDALHGRRPPGAAGPVRLDWAARTRIGAQVAAALQHLHDASLAHGRLQPSAVLLDAAMQARLGDTSVAGSFGAHQVRQAQPYLAPEVAAGCAPTPASDVYSLGVALLQLLTGSEPSGLVSHVEEAARSASIECITDPCAGGWPLEDSTALCQLALRCTAQSPGDRPRLASELLPALSRLSGRAESAVRLTSEAAASSQEPPTMLVCPITQELIEDPVVAADGFTYSRAAIDRWLRSGHSTSPMTNLCLAHKHLTPNYTLRSVALDWKAARDKLQSSSL